MDYMAFDLIQQVAKAITVAKTNQNNDKIYPVGLGQTQKDLETFALNYQALRKGDIQQRIDENRASLKTNLAILLASTK
jgi:hypothetical protein